MLADGRLDNDLRRPGSRPRWIRTTSRTDRMELDLGFGWLQDALGAIAQRRR